MLWGVASVVTLLISAVAAVWLERIIARERRALAMPPTRSAVCRWRPVAVTIGATTLILGLAWAELVGGCLATPEVQPDESSRLARAIYHGGLVLLLVLGSTIDLDCYLLPDVITVPGMLWGLGGAILWADLQVVHLWVDWSVAIPQLRGPMIPEWYDQWRMLHAAAWSGAGFLTGGLLTAGVRSISRAVLGQESMGFGDVTWMAMIGSVIGWQAVVLTFALAPLTGLVIALIGKMTFNRPYLPYGPCLSLAAIVVLASWSPLWEATRVLFGDLVALGMILAIATGALVLLLGLVRLYRSIPTR